MKLLWAARKDLLEHDIAVIAWALSVDKEVRDDVSKRLTGKHRDTIERVIAKFYSVDPDANVPELTDIFWVEFKHWQKKTGPYANAARWTTIDARTGKSHMWHEKYSLPYTDVLGVMACRYTSKQAGIGPCEHAWGDVKVMKSGKRCHLSGDSVEKQAVLYTTSRINEARVRRAEMERIDAPGPNAMWGDDDIK
jgi:hypothetical protein